MADDRFRRLAHKIEALRRKDESNATRRAGIVRQRSSAARQLHEICRRFADRLNSYIKEDQIDLVPSEMPEELEDDFRQQIMLNVRGRVLLIALEAPPALVSTDNFRKAYILQGEVRFFNQELLDEALVEEHGLFFCPSEGPKGADGHRQGAWLFWNGRNYKSGLVDEDYLAGLLEQLM